MITIEERKEKYQELRRKWNREHPEKEALYRMKNPDKNKAWHIVEKIQRNTDCSICKSTLNLVKHHPDYSKPLEVITLCSKCHNELHHGKDKEVKNE